jgi:hypothetical protein
VKAHFKPDSPNITVMKSRKEGRNGRGLRTEKMINAFYFLDDWKGSDHL